MLSYGVLQGALLYKSLCSIALALCPSLNYMSFSQSPLPIYLLFCSQYGQVKLLVNNQSVACVPEIYFS